MGSFKTRHGHLVLLAICLRMRWHMFASLGKAAGEVHPLNEWPQSLLLVLQARGTPMQALHRFPKEESQKNSIHQH